MGSTMADNLSDHVVVGTGTPADHVIVGTGTPALDVI